VAALRKEVEDFTRHLECVTFERKSNFPGAHRLPVLALQPVEGFRSSFHTNWRGFLNLIASVRKRFLDHTHQAHIITLAGEIFLVLVKD
jgi:hypothetical protein